MERGVVYSAVGHTSCARDLYDPISQLGIHFERLPVGLIDGRGQNGEDLPVLERRSKVTDGFFMQVSQDPSPRLATGLVCPPGFQRLQEASHDVPWLDALSDHGGTDDPRMLRAYTDNRLRY